LNRGLLKLDHQAPSPAGAPVRDVARDLRRAEQAREAVLLHLSGRLLRLLRDEAEHRGLALSELIERAFAGELDEGEASS
jgi:hypothetical protein